MKIGLVSGGYPPEIDGIGDYTAWMAKALISRQDVEAPVSVFTSTGKEREQGSGIDVIQFFDRSSPGGFGRLVELSHQRKLDWLLLQYNPFSYGARGICYFVPETIVRLKKLYPKIRVAVMFHETFMKEKGLKPALLGVLQKMICRRLAASSDVCFVSVEGFSADVNTRNGKDVEVLPVGSNLPELSIDPREAKQQFGWEEGDLVMGTFGQKHPSRKIDWMFEAFEQVKKQIPKARFLYIGGGGDEMRRHIQDASLITTGPLSGVNVAKSIHAIDIYLSPFVDGVSTRRGSFVAALQHGSAIVGTDGSLTDQTLRGENGKSFELVTAGDSVGFAGKCIELACHTEYRQRLGRNARLLFERTFAWDVLCERMLGSLGSVQNKEVQSL